MLPLGPWSAEELAGAWIYGVAILWGMFAGVATWRRLIALMPDRRPVRRKERR